MRRLPLHLLLLLLHLLLFSIYYYYFYIFTFTFYYLNGHFKSGPGSDQKAARRYPKVELDRYYVPIYIKKRHQETDMLVDVACYCWTHKHTPVIKTNKQEPPLYFLTFTYSY